MRWISNSVEGRKARELAGALGDLRLNVAAGTLPVLADLLIRRGIERPEEAARFLAPKLEDLHDPMRMAGMRAALERLKAAIDRKEKVMVYGDYDVDGTTAIVILKTAIELCGGAADFHVPHRIREGYDLREDVIERSAAAGSSAWIRGFGRLGRRRRRGAREWI